MGKSYTKKEKLLLEKKIFLLFFAHKCIRNKGKGSYLVGTRFDTGIQPGLYDVYVIFTKQNKLKKEDRLSLTMFNKLLKDLLVVQNGWDVRISRKKRGKYYHNITLVSIYDIKPSNN
jgi:hypothetical protein